MALGPKGGAILCERALPASPLAGEEHRDSRDGQTRPHHRAQRDTFFEEED